MSDFIAFTDVMYGEEGRAKVREATQEDIDAFMS